MECDLCGKRSEKAILVNIEGIEMKVCESCSKHGKTIKILNDNKNKKKELFGDRLVISRKSQESEEVVVSNFSQVLRKEREKRNIEQDKFAQLISEKLSILQKLEKGELTPSIEVAKKIGKKLNLNLITKESNESFDIPKSSGKGLTLGDLIKPKKEN
jgi:putative transcription factor